MNAFLESDGAPPFPVERSTTIGPLECRIDLQAGRYFLIGLCDPPAVRVNGRVVTAVPLRDGDEIVVRGATMRFRCAADGMSRSPAVPPPAARAWSGWIRPLAVAAIAVGIASLLVALLRRK